MYGICPLQAYLKFISFVFFKKPNKTVLFSAVEKSFPLTAAPFFFSYMFCLFVR